MSRLVIAFLILLLSATPTFAQLDPNEWGDACTRQDIGVLAVTIRDTGVMRDLVDVFGGIDANATLRTVANTVEDLEAIQTQWWDEIVPSLPQCNAVAEYVITLGVGLDEFLIGLSLQYTAATARTNGDNAAYRRWSRLAEQHVERGGALISDAADISDTLFDSL